MKGHRRLGLLLVVGILAPGIGIAEHPSAPVLLQGHVRNIHGAGTLACIHAYPAESSGNNVVDLVEEWSAQTNESGEYSMLVHPGRLRLIASESDYEGGVRRCWDGGHYLASQEHVIDTVAETGASVDFLLPYRMVAGSYGATPCCSTTAGHPGTVLKLIADVPKAAGSGTKVFWNDGLGAEVELALYGNHWADPNVNDFRGTYTIPADAPDGTYVGTFTATTPGIQDPVQAVPLTIHVDTVPPTFDIAYPADGANDITPQVQFFLRLADDNSGGAAFASLLKLYDVTDGGRTSIPCPWSCAYSDWWIGGAKTDAWDLVSGHEYEADITIRDFANNPTMRTFRFTVGDGTLFRDPFPSPTTSDPYAQIGTYLTSNVDPSELSMRIQGPSNSILPRRPFHDPATGRVWLQPGSPDANGNASLAPLLPGTYRATLTGRRFGGNFVTSEWTFTVTAA